MKQAILVAFGRRLRELRVLKGLTQEQLAAVSGLDRSYVGGVERGERNVSLLNLYRLAQALDVTLQELLKIGRE